MFSHFSRILPLSRRDEVGPMPNILTQKQIAAHMKPAPWKTALRFGKQTTHNDRDLEWFCSLAFVVMGFTLMIPGDTLNLPQFASFRVFGLGESFYTGSFITIGVFRSVVLAINGKSPKTPAFRLFGACLGAAVWGQLCWMFHIATRDSYGCETLMEGPCILFAVTEAYSACRAMFDARYAPH